MQIPEIVREDEAARESTMPANTIGPTPADGAQLVGEKYVDFPQDGV